MPEEGEHLHMEPQSTAGKWILTILAIAFVAVSGYTHYVMHTTLQKVTSDLAGSQAQVKELQDRMQTQEAQQETLARQAGMTKKELVQKTAELQAEERATATKADLEATKAKLQTAVGDLTGQSELIATTRSDLEVLKHKGDRNYYEFTLLKGAKPQPVSTVSLQLKKADAKKGKFTLNVTSDDKTIEKK